MWARRLPFEKTPYRISDPLSSVLIYLIAKQHRFTVPPFIPKMTQLSMAEQCQLVLLWAIAGEEEAAAQLASSLPLDFPWAWSRENEYDVNIARQSIALLKKAITEEPLPSMNTLYFQTLKERLPKIRCSIRPFSSSFITFSGVGTSLGAFLSPHGEIRAFGPQGLPLSDSRGFGLRTISPHENRWISPIALPEVWCDVKYETGPNSFVLDLTFFGLIPEHPLFFSFYVWAESAMIDGTVLKPRSLQKYRGEAKEVRFGESFRIRGPLSDKLEVIPLAGDGPFWGSTYLAAFEIHPFNAKASFVIDTTYSRLGLK